MTALAVPKDETSAIMAEMASPWNHNIHYYDLVVTSAVSSCGRALDVGCGQGLLAGRLAQHCRQVMAIDIDGDVITRAGKEDAGLNSRTPDSRIQFIHGDVMTY